MAASRPIEVVTGFGYLRLLSSRLSGTMDTMDDAAPQPITPPKSHRRWFRFSLRTMMIVVTLLCIGMGVTAYRANRQRKAVETIKKAGGSVGYDYQTDGDGWPISGDPPGPAWLRNLIGIDYFATVVSVTIKSEKGSHDDSVAALAELPQLSSLDMRGKGITDSTLLQIKGFTLLNNLCLSRTQVSDTGLLNIKGLTRLRHVTLVDSNTITDAGVQHLKGLTHLESVYFSGTKITADGVKDLRRVLPKLSVNGSTATEEKIRPPSALYY